MRELIERIEEQFLGLDTKNLIALYVMTLFLIGGGAYYFLFDSLLQEYQSNQNKIVQLQKKIKKNNPKILEIKIKRLKKEIAVLRKEIEELRLRSLLLQEKLQKKRYAALTPKNFSTFLDIMLQKSLKRDVNVHEVTIKEEQHQLIGKLYELRRVELLFAGRFLPIVDFVRETEALPYLFNIDELNLTKGENGVHVELAIRFYGAKQ